MQNKTSINILLVLLSAVILFHLSVMAKIVPYDIAWGGRLQNDSEMYIFETLSILIILFLELVLLMKGNYMKFQFGEKTIDIILWIFLTLFLLNTIGNIFAKTDFEKLFAAVTLAFAFLIWTILRIKKVNGTQKETTS